MNPLSQHFLAMAFNNLWANHRLLTACSQLSQAEFEAVRVSFFPSIKATLNHNLTVDWFYVDALERELADAPPHDDCYVFFKLDEPFATCEALTLEQQRVDRRLIAYCEQLRDADNGRYVTIARPANSQRDSRARLLAHVFQHQIHHRGQTHAMLSATSVKPPQLDEFFSEGEVRLRFDDLAALGLSEERIWSQ